MSTGFPAMTSMVATGPQMASMYAQPQYAQAYAQPQYVEQAYAPQYAAAPTMTSMYATPGASMYMPAAAPQMVEYAAPQMMTTQAPSCVAAPQQYEVIQPILKSRYIGQVRAAEVRAGALRSGPVSERTLRRRTGQSAPSTAANAGAAQSEDDAWTLSSTTASAATFSAALRSTTLLPLWQAALPLPPVLGIPPPFPVLASTAPEAHAAAAPGAFVFAATAPGAFGLAATAPTTWSAQQPVEAGGSLRPNGSGSPRLPDRYLPQGSEGFDESPLAREQKPGLDQDEIEMFKAAFDIFDTKKSGKILLKDLKVAMQQFGYESNHLNQSSVDFKEFVALMSEQEGKEEKANKASIFARPRSWRTETDDEMSQDVSVQQIQLHNFLPPQRVGLVPPPPPMILGNRKRSSPYLDGEACSKRCKVQLEKCNMEWKDKFDALEARFKEDEAAGLRRVEEAVRDAELRAREQTGQLRAELEDARSKNDELKEAMMRLMNSR